MHIELVAGMHKEQVVDNGITKNERTCYMNSGRNALEVQR